MSSWDLYADRRRTGRKFAKCRLEGNSYPSLINASGAALDADLQQSFEFNFASADKKSNTHSSVSASISNYLASNYSPGNYSPSNSANIESVLPFSACPVGELSEIRTKTDENIFHLLLPILSKLNSENRWITLISPPSDIDKKLFAYHGIDVSRVLLIHPSCTSKDTVIMNKALKNGNSGIVIMWTDKLPKRFVAQWRKSVKQGNCRGVIVNHDTTDHYSESVALALDVKSSDKAITIIPTQKFGKAISYKAKSSFPIINLEAYSEPERFSLAN